MTYNGNCRSSELTPRISEYWYGKLGINAFSINVFIKIFFMGGGTSYIRWLLIWPKIVLQCLLMRPLLKIRSSWDYLGINSRIFLKFSWEIQGIPGLVFFARNFSLWPFRWIFSRDYFSCSEWWRDVDNWLGQHFLKNSAMGFLLCNNKLMQKYLFGIFNLLEPPLKWVFF